MGDVDLLHLHWIQTDVAHRGAPVRIPRLVEVRGEGDAATDGILEGGRKIKIAEIRRNENKE